MHSEVKAITIRLFGTGRLCVPWSMVKVSEDATMGKGAEESHMLETDASCTKCGREFHTDLEEHKRSTCCWLKLNMIVTFVAVVLSFAGILASIYIFTELKSLRRDNEGFSSIDSKQDGLHGNKEPFYQQSTPPNGQVCCIAY